LDYKCLKCSNGEGIMGAFVKRLARFAVPLALVFAGFGIGPPTAHAVASTGQVTVEGWYYYSAYDDGYYTSKSLSIYSWLCTDSWAGTTTTLAGGGASCYLSLGGGSYGSNNLQLDGGYYASGGTHAYGLQLNTDAAYPFWAGPGTATGTARANYGYYEGPAVLDYTLTMTNDCNFDLVYGCGEYTYWSQGEVTLTLEYAVH
jgi:hypothetical protein